MHVSIFNMDAYKFCQVLSFLRNTLSVLEFKYLPSNSMKMFKHCCLNVSKISVGNPGKTLKKVLNFALGKVRVP